MQPEVNIGLVGHVDHGKTTLTKALSGVWTDRHSEEIKRGISIRLGYADCTFRKCPKCLEPDCYTTKEKCEKCGTKPEVLRKVSFVDAPGHETLIATMLSGAAVMDGALLVISADEACPQPQTVEHLMALQIVGVKNVVVVQNKIDIVPSDNAREHKKSIEKMLSQYKIRAPIIPIAANQDINVDAVIAAIENFIPSPKRDESKPAMMYVARSFDVNRPGIPLEKLKGGVLGGSIIQGKLRVGEEIEIKPGIKVVEQNRENWRPIITTVESLASGDEDLREAKPGGLVAVGTALDPQLTKSDALSGNVIGAPGKIPESRSEITCEFNIMGRVTDEKAESIKVNDALMLSIGTCTTLGLVKKQEGPSKFALSLKKPAVMEAGMKFAVSRKIDMRWRLIGYGVMLS